MSKNNSPELSDLEDTVDHIVVDKAPKVVNTDKKKKKKKKLSANDLWKRQISRTVRYFVLKLMRENQKCTFHSEALNNLSVYINEGAKKVISLANTNAINANRSTVLFKDVLSAVYQVYGYNTFLHNYRLYAELLSKQVHKKPIAKPTKPITT
jgi:histone H3/H4